MAVNKVVYDGNTLIDLTSDTVTAETLLSGYQAHTSGGISISGSLVVQNYYTGTSEPSSSLGNDGDLYFKLEG